MSNHKYSRQFPDIGSVAMRLLTIPVLSIALVVSYLLLRSSADEPALMADVAPGLMVAPDEALVAPTALRAAPSREGAASRDAAVVAHEVLDPVGAGRNPMP
jgi:hypothetical protein